MKSAYIQISGSLVREPQIIQRTRGVAEIIIYIDDGSGIIPIKAFHGEARELVLSGKLPRLGDVVQVSGIIRSDTFGDFYLELGKTENLVIQKIDLPQKTLLSIRQDGFRGAAQLEVQVQSVTAPNNLSKQPWTFLVSDETSTMNFIIWNSIIEPAMPLDWGPGAKLKGRFVVGSFRGNPQITISAIKDIELVNPGAKIDIPSTADINNNGVN